jgi:hypothetical protein
MSVEPLTLTAGVVAGVVLSLAVLAWAIRDAISEKRVAKQRAESGSSVKVWLVLSAVAAVALYVYAVMGEGSLVAAVVAGLMTMVAAIMWVDYRMVAQRRLNGGRARVDEPRLASAALSARRRQIMLSLVTMAFGVFIVFVVGLNRRSFGDSANLQGATGGYTLWCESSVPLQHDPSSEDGRERLGLKQEWQMGMEVMPCFRFQADDASCLNLNKVSKPTVLGVDFEQMRGREFDFGRSIFDGDVIDGLKQSLAEGEYPALVDETVLTDVLKVCAERGNAVTSMPYNEQIFLVDDEISTTKYIPRETLRRVQTPQAYRFGLLDRSYHRAFQEGIGIKGSAYTNTMMVELGERLYFAAGSDKNIKLTTKDDLEMFKAYLKSDKDNWLK